MRRLLWAHFAAYLPAFSWSLAVVPLGIMRTDKAPAATDEVALLWLIAQPVLVAFLLALVLGHLVFGGWIVRGDRHRRLSFGLFACLSLAGFAAAAIGWARVLA